MGQIAGCLNFAPAAKPRQHWGLRGEKEKLEHVWH